MHRQHATVFRLSTSCKETGKCNSNLVHASCLHTLLYNLRLWSLMLEVTVVHGKACRDRETESMLKLLRLPSLTLRLSMSPIRAAVAPSTKRRQSIPPASTASQFPFSRRPQP